MICNRLVLKNMFSKQVASVALISAVLCILICAGCEAPRPPVEKKIEIKKEPVIVSRDLEDIKEEGVIRLITRNNSSSYFLSRGGQFGYEFELAMTNKELSPKLKLI